MEVICIETEAFIHLSKKLREKYEQKNRKWMQAEKLMRLLGIKPKSTLQKLRNEGKIRYTQIGKKIILYDRESIEQYLEKQAKDVL